MAEKRPYKIKTKSLCPQCLNSIPADIVEEKGKILIKKRCAEHGYFEDIYWSNAALYHKFAAYADDGEGIANPQTKRQKGCPADCGLCDEHKTSTLLANLDVTNRCNQTCPICFANSAICGYLYEPAFKEVVRMMETLRSQKPVPAPAIQFSGGEPTLRPDLPKIIKTAKKMGFIQVQIASNGVRLAASADYGCQLRDAGLNTIYLQFDGLKEKTYKKIRGYNALPNKLRAIANCRKAGLKSIVLVPTIARGTNDEEIGDIIKFAAENCDVVKSVNFQPISFSGRIERKELAKMRITIPDVLEKIEEKTQGEISVKDFTAVPFISAVSRFISAWKNKPVPMFTIHPHCGAATYVFIENGKMTPITRFIDADAFRKLILRQTENLKNGSSSNFTKVKVIGEIVKELPSLIDKKFAPKNIKVVDLIIGVLKNDSREALQAFHNNVLFIGVMHFMDPYNFDIERVSRCGIHYVTPDRKIVPFCSYNTFYREAIEKKFSKQIK